MTFEELKTWCKEHGYNAEIPWAPALYSTKTGKILLYIGDKKAKLITGDTNEYAEFKDIEDEYINNGNKISK